MGVRLLPCGRGYGGAVRGLEGLEVVEEYQVKVWDSLGGAVSDSSEKCFRSDVAC